VKQPGEARPIAAVVGYAISVSGDQVLLIRKNRPPAQAGKLNGVGGKVEPGERFIGAMVREFREETGVETSESDWTCFATLDSPGWNLAFFVARLPDDVLGRASSLTDETLEVCVIADLKQANTMRNLQWMIPFCLDASPYELPVKLKELPQ